MPRFDSSGRQIGAIVILENITDQKAFETELRKLYQAVEQSPSTVVITDTEGRIEYVNPKFSETTGYSREEALGKNPNILKSGAQSPEVYADLWQTISSGRVWRGELLNRKKNNELYWEMAAISGVRGDRGRITHYVAVKEDITTRKIAEQNLKRELDINRAAARLAETLISSKRRSVKSSTSSWPKPWKSLPAVWFHL